MATISAYTKLERVGRGSYGEVFKVRRHSDGMEMVLKEVSMVGICEQEEREILNETSCMMQLSHPHIISYFGSFLERGSLHIVMEFASGGDLQCLIRRHAQAGTFVIEERLWKFLIQLTQGLQHAHSRRILHRDVKASNVFIDANDNIKIGDLGLGKVLGDKRCALSQVGTPIYMSPEMCEGKPYDTKSDVWALGCLLFELAALKPPFQAANQTLLARKIINDAPDSQVPSHYSREIPFIIAKLLEKDSRRRPSPDSILNYSAVQIRLERARFQAREAELLGQLEEAKRQELRRAIQHASDMRSALKQQHGGDTLHAELAAEREKVRGERERWKEQERGWESEREEWKRREAALVERCRVLEHDKNKERQQKEEALQQLQQNLQQHEFGNKFTTLETCDTDGRSTKREPCLASETSRSYTHATDHDVCIVAEAAPHTPGGIEAAHLGKRQEAKTQETAQTPCKALEDAGLAQTLVPHKSMGGRSAESARGRDDAALLPIPTPSNLFISPKASASSPYTPGSNTPLRGLDRGTALERSLELSVDRCRKRLVGGIRRTLLTGRSLGDGDGLRISRQEPSAISPATSAATPLRGPMRGSADSITPSRTCNRSGENRESHQKEDMLNIQRRQMNSGMQRGWGHADEENSADDDCSVEMSVAAAVPQRRGYVQDDTCTRSDVDAHTTPKRSTQTTSSTTPGSPSFSTPALKICSSTDENRSGEGDASAPQLRTPSVSVMTGCIRARQRTPQRSLGPAQRVPLPERLPQNCHAASTRDAPASEATCAWMERRGSGGDMPEQASWEGQMPQPKFSRSSPKSVGGGPKMEDYDVETAVADILALTEGLRRSAQMALNASSSSGGSSDSPKTTTCGDEMAGSSDSPKTTTCSRTSPSPSFLLLRANGAALRARRLEFVEGTAILQQ